MAEKLDLNPFIVDLNGKTDKEVEPSNNSNFDKVLNSILEEIIKDLGMDKDDFPWEENFYNVNFDFHSDINPLMIGNHVVYESISENYKFGKIVDFDREYGIYKLNSGEDIKPQQIRAAQRKSFNKEQKKILLKFVEKMKTAKNKIDSLGGNVFKQMLEEWNCSYEDLNNTYVVCYWTNQHGKRRMLLSILIVDEFLENENQIKILVPLIHKSNSNECIEVSICPDVIVSTLEIDTEETINEEAMGILWDRFSVAYRMLPFIKRNSPGFVILNEDAENEAIFDLIQDYTDKQLGY